MKRYRAVWPRHDGFIGGVTVPNVVGWRRELIRDRFGVMSAEERAADVVHLIEAGQAVVDGDRAFA